MKNRKAISSTAADSQDKEIPFIRVGTDYFKKIWKSDRFGMKRIELKPWNRNEIKLDDGFEYLRKIPKYDDFIIDPANISYKPVVDNCYNLYREFIHKPEPGVWKWSEILMNQVFGEQIALGYRYMQILYLHPKKLMPILVLVSRARQTGKTTFINWLNMIFGDNMANISPDDLVNGFNSIYARSNIIAVEETLIEKSLTIEKIKALVTNKFVTVNQKYISQYRMPFYGKIILTSNNEEKFARIDEEEIRFFIRKLGLPQFTNHNIEDNLSEEIPAFIHHLTTLPPLDFTKDRSGFTPDELDNDFLRLVKNESKSWLCKSLMMLVEDLFNNDLAHEDHFYADPVSIKEKFFSKDQKVDLPFIRQVLKTEMHMEAGETPEYRMIFNGDVGKTARFYRFERDQFVTTESDFLTNSKQKLPF